MEKVLVTVAIGTKSITAAKAKSLLGWQEATKDQPTHVRDTQGTKIFLENNTKNRPISKSNYLALQQDILQDRWRFNGEPIILGTSGALLNGQHSLIALVLADQVCAAYPEKYPKAPSIEKLIVKGVSEDKAVINTMDTCRPRTLMDVLYRSEYFSDLSGPKRKATARAVDYAIRLLWHRTGTSLDPFRPKRTHAEAIAFLDQHPTLLECVRITVEEESLKHTISPGYAAALLYLMAVSKSDPQTYRESPTEAVLDLTLQNKAEDFFVIIAAGVPVIEKVLKKLAAQERDCLSVRIALLVKAWHSFLEEGQITEDALQLKWSQTEGIYTLAEIPSAGGIDLGDPMKDPTETELVQRAQEEKEKSVNKTRDKKRTWKPRLGRVCWVDDSEEPYKCKIVEILGKNAKVKISQGFQGAGSIRAILVSSLLQTQPIKESQE